jgi:sulfur carrier protein
MSVLVNDKFEIPWREGMTIAELLRACRFTSPMIAVLVNGVSVDPHDFDRQPIQDGDDVKAWHLIGGG